MEDNEQNKELAAQVVAMVAKGCMLRIKEDDVFVALGYAEIWLDRDLIFFCELGNGDTGKQHVLRFATFDPRPNQVIFYDKNGKLVAGLAPYIEWPEVDAHDMQVEWEAWQKDKEGLEGCEQAAKEWRHAQLSAG